MFVKTGWKYVDPVAASQVTCPAQGGTHGTSNLQGGIKYIRSSLTLRV